MNTREFIQSIWDFIKNLFGTPVSPEDNSTPNDSPTPDGRIWRGSMFFPAGGNPWPTNSGVDSPLDWAGCHGNSWENAKRRWCYESILKCGGDTLLFIAERLYGRDVPHMELQMFLTNRAHPQDGHRMNDRENEVVIARGYGINRWIVDLFNDDSTLIPAGAHEDYIKQMAECYAWATPEQVAFMVCLETDERFSPTQALQRVGWIKKYAPGKRIIVGSADGNFLKVISGGGVELWLETSIHPFQLNKLNADSYISSLSILKSYGLVWAGEYGRGSGEAAQYVTQRAQEIGCAGIGSYVQ